MAEALFYVLAAATVAFGVGVIAARVALFSVLALLGAFFCLAAIYLLCGFQFLAATQLLVYAGAIMVLFLFVIMLLDLGRPAELAREEGFALSGRRLTIAGLAAGGLALVGIVAAAAAPVRAATPGLSPPALPEHGLDELGPLAEVLFGRYVLPFEAASVLLLATMIAVVALAKRQRPGARGPRAGAGWPWKKGVEQ